MDIWYIKTILIPIWQSITVWKSIARHFCTEMKSSFKIENHSTIENQNPEIASEWLVFATQSQNTIWNAYEFPKIFIATKGQVNCRTTRSRYISVYELSVGFVLVNYTLRIINQRIIFVCVFVFIVLFVISTMLFKRLMGYDLRR